MKTNKSFSIRIDIPNTDIYKVDIEEIIRDGLEKYESHDKRSFNDVIETTVDVVDLTKWGDNEKSWNRKI